MSVEILDEGPEDVETITVVWLSPLRRTANTRRAGDPLPMTLVKALPGNESVEESTADPVVSVHTLVRKSLGEDNARDEMLKTHKRMLLLARNLDQFNIDYLRVFQTQHREDYDDDQIIQYVGRYQFGQSYA